MPNEIIWTEKASLDFEQIIDFLLNKLNISIANNFIDNIDFNLGLNSQNPLLFPEINKARKIHRCVMNKHNSIIYRNNFGSIEIIRILNNRSKTVEF